MIVARAVMLLNRWRLLWAATMALMLIAGVFYVRANWPAPPGVYWLFPYPSKDTPDELQRKAEASHEFQAAFAAVRDQRQALLLRTVAVWMIGGVAIYGIGLAVRRIRPAR
jgi:hypothetical protein